MVKLCNNFDYGKTYYKITNGLENHHGLEYHTGIVTDILGWNEDLNDEYCAGRMYFTTLENLHLFFWAGSNIRPIKIKKGTIVIKENDKFGVHEFKMLDKISFKKYFEMICGNGIFDRMSNEYLWRFPKFFPNSIKVWFDKVAARMPNENLWHFPWYCSNSIDIWFEKVIERMPDADLWHFPKYCSTSVGFWGNHPRLKNLLKVG